MKNTKSYLSDEQVEKLKGLLAEVHAKGFSLASIARNYPEYEYKVIKYWNMRFYPDPSKMKDIEKGERVKKLLEEAYKEGISLVDIQKNNPDLSIGSLQYWNRLFNILPIRKGRVFSPEKIQEVLKHVLDYDIDSASKLFNVDPGQIYKWNKEHKVFKAKREIKFYTEEEKIRLLTEAQEYNFKNNSKSGVGKVSKKYKVRHTVLYEWNKKYKIVLTDGRSPKTLLEEVEIDYIVEKAKLFKTVKALAKEVGREPTTVKNVLELRGIICNRYGIHLIER